MKLEFEGDFYEDKGNFQAIILSHKMASAIYEAKDLIRRIIKYRDNISEEEITTLDRIDDILSVEGLEL
jgi:hypothetical protein